MNVIKGTSTWLLIFSADDRGRVANALAKAKIVFVAAKGGDVNGVVLTIVEIDQSKYQEAEITAALAGM